MKLATLQKLLRKYQHGTATKAERYVVDRWYESFDAQRQGIPGMEDKALKDSIKARIWQGVPNQAKHKPWYGTQGFRVAAGVVLALSTAIWLYMARDLQGQHADDTAHIEGRLHVVTTDIRQVKQVQLPDSTQVWLNANSRLEVMPDYGRGERRLLLSGEAYFDVRRDTTTPFIVVANKIAVHVLGTSFNIQSYENVHEVSVAVNTGRVLVTDEASRPLDELTGGQELTYQPADKRHYVHAVSGDDRYAWRTGKIVFERADFEKLAQGFYNLYGVRLNTDDKQVLSDRYNLTLQSTMRIEEAMELICIILRRNYKEEENGDIVIY